MKNLVDTISTINQPLIDLGIRSYILDGLNSNNEFLVTTIISQLNIISLDAPYEHVLTHETRLEHQVLTSVGC